jgi:hypothetical protein
MRATHMLEFLDRFWIAMPLSYAVAVGGLFAGFRRGGVSPEHGIQRALITGIPTVVCALIGWAIIVNRAEALGTRGLFFPGLENGLALLFIASLSALAGALLARRRRTHSRRASDRQRVPDRQDE